MGDKTIYWDPKNKADAERGELEVKAMKAAGYHIVDQTPKAATKVRFLATKTKPKAKPKASAETATKASKAAAAKTTKAAVKK